METQVQKGMRFMVISDKSNFFSKGEIGVALDNSVYAPYCVREKDYHPEWDISKYKTEDYNAIATCDLEEIGLYNIRPLTLEEMKNMAGLPVYCQETDSFGIIKYEKVKRVGVGQVDQLYLNGVWYNSTCDMSTSFNYDIIARNLTCYGIISEQIMEEIKKIRKELQD